MPDFIYIDQSRDLRRLSLALKDARKIGVDLEADSMFHYKEKICLVQITNGHENYLIDTLAVDGLSPLKGLFADSGILKVFHGADYDIRLLHRDYGIEISPLFDTQIAARFLGVTAVSLANLLASVLGVSIDKKYQKADWSERPLSRDMLIYSAMDVSYLIPLAGALEKELQAKGRLPWVREECRILSRVRAIQRDGQPLFLRFKGAGKLKSRDLAVLESILQFRENRAKTRDLPPFKILRNTVIMEIVKTKPASKNDLKGIHGLSPKQVQMFGDAILQCIREGMGVPEAELPVYPRKEKNTHHRGIVPRVRALKRWRDEKAQALDLDPALLFPNALLQSLARYRPKRPLDLAGVAGIREWQIQAFGRDLCTVLAS